MDDYLEILEDTLVAMRLPAFEAKLRVRERRHPKKTADGIEILPAAAFLGELERGALFP